MTANVREKSVKRIPQVQVEDRSPEGRKGLEQLEQTVVAATAVVRAAGRA